MYSSQWYDSLIQPPFSPPSQLFAPVWAILYLMIFASIVTYSLKKSDRNKTTGYIFFSLQMFFNIIWPQSFFIFRNIELSLTIIVMLNIFVILTINKFRDISKISAALLIPYSIWITYATYLNFGYYILNFK